jgi:hypothetical protein
VVSRFAADPDDERADGLLRHVCTPCSALMTVVVAEVFFRVMSSIVSFVSSGIRLLDRGESGFFSKFK